MRRGAPRPVARFRPDGRKKRAPGAISRLLAHLGAAPERDPLVAARARVRPGDVVGRFELVREIGRGGFGVVFEARDRTGGRRVAIKTALPAARTDAARESLERELEVAHLRHPNIHAALEGGRCAAGPFVVLEYLSGETLASRLARGPLPLEQLIEVAIAVAAALRYAHRRGVLHRDVKPANVFLPSGGAPKLIDFGLARVNGRAAPSGSGTSAYMSPEQRRGGCEDGRADLFALGRLIRDMAAGTRDPALLGPRDREAALDPTALPLDLDRLAGRLADDDPARRPGAAEEVLASLRTIRRSVGAGASSRRRTGHLALVRDVRTERNDARSGRGGEP